MYHVKPLRKPGNFIPNLNMNGSRKTAQQDEGERTLLHKEVL